MGDNVNVPMLRKALEHITAHPEEHNQGFWLKATETACGTVGCLAGNGLLLAGQVVARRPAGCDIAGCGLHDGGFAVVRPGFAEHDFEGAAADLFGLSRQGAAALFHAGNSLYRLWEIARVITDGEIQIPPGVHE